MDVRKEIKKQITKIQRTNEARTKSYKAKVKEQIRVNIVEKGQTKEKNEHLIRKFYNAKPKQLTTMQLALLEAAQ